MSKNSVNYQTTMMRRGICFVLAAPSGAGKSTLARALLDSDRHISLSISVTTRPPRSGERDGIDYYFVDDSRFASMAEDGTLLESAQVFGRSYGTPRAPVEATLAAGCDVLFDIDWQGWRQLKAALPADCVGVFILPPSGSALKARLVGRASDSPTEIAKRMAMARSEIAHWHEFDHVLINDRFEDCLAALRAILLAARTATARSTGIPTLVQHPNDEPASQDPPSVKSPHL